MVAANEAQFDVLYFDCSEDTATISASEKISSCSWKIMPSTAAVVTWSILSQALCKRCPSARELGGCLSDIKAKYPRVFVDSTEECEVSLQALEELFQAELNGDTGRETIVLLDHVDVLDPKQLKSLRHVMRQSRCLFTGISNSETKLVLQGMPSVDEDTEYHGNP